MQKRVPVETIDAYFATQPEETARLLEKVRQTIKAAVPEAIEVISYAIPAFKLNKVFVFFAGFKNHWSLFVPKVLGNFKDELAPYKTTKATINFPLDKPVPVALIQKLVKASAEYDAAQAELKKKKKNKG